MAQFINPPLLPVAKKQGTFSAAISGFGSAPVVSCSWKLLGSFGCIYIPAFSGVSNATTMTLTGYPSDIYSTADVIVPIYGLTDNSSSIYLGCAADINGATLTFIINGDAATPFTNSGTKGVPSPIAVLYPL
jgi:hypothetical protein